MFGSFFGDGDKKKRDASTGDTDAQEPVTPIEPAQTEATIPIPPNEASPEESTEAFAEKAVESEKHVDVVPEPAPDIDSEEAEDAHEKINEHQANLSSIREETAGIVREEHPENTPTEPLAVTDHKMHLEKEREARDEK